MAAKMLTPEQCQWMHQRFPPPDCCLCNAKDEIARLEAALAAAREEALEAEAALQHSRDAIQAYCDEANAAKTERDAAREEAGRLQKENLELAESLCYLADVSSGGRISKPNYTKEVYESCFQDHIEERVAASVVEATEELKAERDALCARVAELEAKHEA